jgi:hypothetical protein
MSAWMPAPAPESEPATVSTCGHGISRADATTGNLRGRVAEEGETPGEKEGGAEEKGGGVGGAVRTPWASAQVEVYDIGVGDGDGRVKPFSFLIN